MAANRIRVLSWNILEGGSDGRLDGILQLARSVRPDVVGFQECNGWHVRGEKILRRAARELGMAAFPFWTTSGFQPVLLTRLDGARAVPHDDQDRFSLGYQEVVLPLAGSRKWHYFHTHLNPFSEEVRLAEIRIIARAMAPHRSEFCSLAGDLNCLAPGERYFGMRTRPRMRVALNKSPFFRLKFDFCGLNGLCGYGSVEEPNAWMRVPYRTRRLVEHAELRTDVYLHLKRAGWVDAFRRLHPREPGFTLPTNMPSVRIDYVWLSPSLARRLVRCEVLYGRRILKSSDHCPILWEIDVS